MPLSVHWKQEIPFSKATILLPVCLSLLVTSLSVLSEDGVCKQGLMCSHQAPALNFPSKHEHYLGIHMQSQKQTGISASVTLNCAFCGTLSRTASTPSLLFHSASSHSVPYMKLVYCMISILFSVGLCIDFYSCSRFQEGVRNMIKI